MTKKYLSLSNSCYIIIQWSSPYESKSTAFCLMSSLSCITLGGSYDQFTSLPLQTGAEGGNCLVSGSPAPGARGLQCLLVSPLVEPLDVVVAAQEAVSGLQFPPQQVQEVTGEVAPPVVDLPHYNVSGPLGASGGVMLEYQRKVSNQATFMFK